MCSGCLRDLPVRGRLDGVNEIGELDGILDEENGDVVADDVKIALIGVADPFVSWCCLGFSDSNLQSGSKAVDISSSIGAASGSGDGREPHEHRSLLALGGQEVGGREIAPVTVTGERTMGTSSTSVDSPFWNLFGTRPCQCLGANACLSLRSNTIDTYPLVVKVLNFLAENKVLQQGRSSSTGFQTFLVRYWAADVGRHVTLTVVDLVMFEYVR